MNIFGYEFLIILILILINGIFSMSEIAIISAKRARLMQKSKSGSEGAKAALELADSPNTFLSTIQVGITTIGIIMGAFSGSTIAKNLVPFFQQFSLTARYSDTIAFTIVVITVSYLSLILGELVPKRIALNRAEDIAQIISRPMRILSLIASPFVYILTKSMDMVLFVLHLQKVHDPTITQEEISHALDLGRIAGLVEPDEQKIVKRVLQFGDRQAHSIMTPRPNVIWLDIELPVEEIIKTVTDNPFSRYPVMKDSPDNIVGIINARDILRFMDHQVSDFKFLIQEPLFVVKNLSILNVVETFRQHPLHFALVIDEYGGFMGIITPYDILQALIGELPLGHIVPGIRKSKLGSWYIDGSIPIQEFKIFFNIDEFPEEYRYGTLSGFIMHVLGHIPSTGEHFDWNGFSFTVVSMVHNRVNEVVVHTPQNKSF